jgi:hypothetical protein
MRGEVSPRVSLNVEPYKEETSVSAGNKTKSNETKVSRTTFTKTKYLREFMVSHLQL